MAPLQFDTFSLRMEKMEVWSNKTFINSNSLPILPKTLIKLLGLQVDIVHAWNPILHFFIDRKNDRLGLSNFLPCTQFHIQTTSFSYKISNFFMMHAVPFPNRHRSTNCKLFYCRDFLSISKSNQSITNTTFELTQCWVGSFNIISCEFLMIGNN